MCWARISPSSACSEKFFEPTTIVLRSLPQEASDASEQSSSHAPKARVILVAPASSRGPQPPFEYSQHKVRRERQQCSRNSAGENQPVIYHRKPAKNEFAEAARAHGRSNRRDSDRQHRR